jgi:hypothetical protein
VLIQAKRTLIAAALTVGLGLLAAAPASATVISWNPPSPFNFTNGSTSGSLLLIDSVFGAPSGSTPFAGPFAGTGPTDVSIVFQLTATAGAIENIGLSVVTGFVGQQITGHGTIAGTGEVAVTTDAGFTNNIFGGQAGFDFASDLDSSNASADESDYFFVSFAAAGFDMDGTENVRLMVDPVGVGQADFSQTGPAIEAPEPAALVILAIGGLAIAGRIGRSRSKR